MSRVDDIKAEIKKLSAELKEIQDECSHPESCTTKVAKSNTGNYDPSCDRYWYDFHCSLCDKRWSEDQEDWNSRQRAIRALAKKKPN